MKKELESFERKISQLYALKQQKKTLDSRIEKLTKDIKNRVIYFAGHPFSMDPDGDPPTVWWNTVVNLKAVVKAVTIERVPDQAEIENLFIKKGIWDKYSELHIPEHAVNEALLNDDLSSVDYMDLTHPAEVRLSLHIERKSDVQSQDECDS